MAKPIYGQGSKVLELGEEMFFNIFNHHPDSSVYDFIKKYFPAFTRERVLGGWTMYPPGPIPVYQSTMHSLLFTKHPYFDAKFREGRLDLLSKETLLDGPGITDFHLWFFFDDKKDAEEAFANLALKFEGVSTRKNVFEINNRKVAHYSDEKGIDVMCTVEFILTPDELKDGEYKIFFRIGALTYTGQKGA